MNATNVHIKDKILLAALPDVPFDGWTEACLENAAQKAGYDAAMVRSVFPRGVLDAAAHLSGWANSKMLDALKNVDLSSLKIRERIALAVRTRLDVLEDYKEAERLALSLWVRPLRKFEAAKLVWATADVIWNWAGDTSTDYNYYTKRALLSGVITSTTLFWLTDNSKDSHETSAFLDRRIENVMSIGKIVGKMKAA